MLSPNCVNSIHSPEVLLNKLKLYWFQFLSNTPFPFETFGKITSSDVTFCKLTPACFFLNIFFLYKSVCKLTPCMFFLKNIFFYKSVLIFTCVHIKNGLFLKENNKDIFIYSKN